jgi:hypothetical protein
MYVTAVLADDDIRHCRTPTATDALVLVYILLPDDHTGMSADHTVQ